MKKINELGKKKWLTTGLLVIAIVGLIWLVIWWQMKKKEAVNEKMSTVPKLETTITADTLENLQNSDGNEKTETENNTDETSVENISAVYGLSPTQAYLKMKNAEAQIKTAGDYLNVVTNYFDSLSTGEIWNDWKEMVTDEEKITFVQEKLAAVPRLDQLTTVTEEMDTEMGRAFLTVETNDEKKVAVVMNLDLTDNGEQLWYVISENFIN